MRRPSEIYCKDNVDTTSSVQGVSGRTDDGSFEKNLLISKDRLSNFISFLNYLHPKIINI